MGKIQPFGIQEVVVASANRSESRRITSLLKKKVIRKIAPRIYTSNFDEEPSLIIKRNWYHILAGLYPDALLSHRSALEFKPTPHGHIFLTYTYTQNVRLPGMTIHFLKGPGRIKGDNPFFENLHVSQEARAFLENLQLTKKKGETSKCLALPELEEKLEAIIRARGEQGLNTLRDEARNIAPVLGMLGEFKKLNQLVSDLLATGKVQNLTSPVAKARVQGEPFDPDRIKLFEILYNELAGNVFPPFRDKNTSETAYNTFAFFESYFSNYIEGTEFTVGEAKEIIVSQTPIPARDEDSHDILGTYQIVSNKKEMAILPKNADDLLYILRRRHAVLLQARTAKKPGEFKDRNNRAGNTEFVDWKLVNGTLKKGFEWYSLLKDPLAKAVYMMFLVSEVHPFLDGNGRIARVMMNAELSSRGLSKIIIPTVYRDDYMGSLRKLTRQRIANPFIRMLIKASEFSAGLHDESMNSMEQYLIECDAFKEPTEGKLKIFPR